jgi:membrane protein implicated in regulation of membrane protease activity
MPKFLKVIIGIGIFILCLCLLAKLLPFLISLAIFVVLVLGIYYFWRKINQDNKKKK